MSKKIIFTLSLVIILVTSIFLISNVKASGPYGTLPYGWVNDISWVQVPAPPIYQETNSVYQHNGQYTLRIDPYSNQWDSFDYSPMIMVSPGDHVVMSVWLKAGGSSYVTQEGAWLGFDYYSASTRIAGMGTPHEAEIGQGYPNYNDPNKDNWFVHWGTDWTLVTWDFIVPSRVYGDGLQSWCVQVGQYATPAYILPWVEKNGNQGSIWGSEFSVYINSSPSLTPTPTPTVHPTTTPTATPYNGPNGIYIQPTPTPPPFPVIHDTPNSPGFITWISNYFDTVSYNVLHPSPTPIPKDPDDPTALADVTIVIILIGLVYITTIETKRRRRKKY